MSCHTLPLDSDVTLVGGLTSLDCQVNGAVASGYAHLFGTHGAFTVALSAALTIYLALVAIGLLTGRTQLTLSAMGPKVLALGFVLTFATAWPSYQTVVYGLLTGGPDQIASAFMGARSGATFAFAARLDALFASVVEVGKALSAMPKAPNLDLVRNLVWASALILLLATLGLLVISRIVLAVLLSVGPIFIVCGLFQGTRGLAEGWLRTSVAFAVAPTLIVLGGSGLLAVISPLIDAVADDPVAAVTTVRPVVALFLACVIYAGLLMALAAAAMGLTRGWRIGTRRASANTSASQVVHGQAAQTTSIQTPASQPQRGAGSADRVSELTSSLVRETSSAAASRTRVVEAIAAPAPATPTVSRRAEGLGHTFRPAARQRTLSRSIG